MVVLHQKLQTEHVERCILIHFPWRIEALSAVPEKVLLGFLSEELIHQYAKVKIWIDGPLEYYVRNNSNMCKTVRFKTDIDSKMHNDPP